MVTIALLGLYYFYRYYYRDDGKDYSPVMDTDQEDYQENESYMEETISTRQLALTTIKKIGSEPKYTEDGHIHFEYQGVIFLMEATDECKFVNLIWPWCHSFSKFDIDEFARVRQVVNDINAKGRLINDFNKDVEEAYRNLAAELIEKIDEKEAEKDAAEV